MQIPTRKLLATQISALAAAATLLPGVAVAQSGGFALEEVIVTAQKREQNLQDVGISVTALDQRSMQRAGITDISRLELVTPGMSYGFIGSDAKVAMRGANSNNTFADNSSIAGFFVDGAKQVINPDDKGMLEDLIIAAVNEGVKKAKQLREAELKKVTGMNLPGFM